MIPKGKYRHWLAGSAFALSILLLTAYSNHFDNDFHFDDAHSVEQNIFIRSMRNIPRMFVDANTFSALAGHQSYRPLVTASLAVDYWLAGGLDPSYFHYITFLAFAAQLGLMYLLFLAVLRYSEAGAYSPALALAATAGYGLHPVCAESVNYIIQRAEIYTTLGIVGGLVLYEYAPVSRKWGLYLVPVTIGTLAKPLTIMFAPILFVYVLLFHQGAGVAVWSRGYPWRKFAAALKISIPTFVACAALYVFQDRMTAHFVAGGSSLTRYVLTQPYVFAHYVKCLFLPNDLTVDSDWLPVSGVNDPRVLGGLMFLVPFIGLAIWSSTRARYRPLSFGIFWFLFVLAPTTFVPLAEVMNDHRMYAPFVGLVLGVVILVWNVTSAAEHLRVRRALTVLSVGLSLVLAWCTYQRNEIWHSEESLWAEAVVKSPRNGRALMNYGLTLMAKGDYSGALKYFEQAVPLTPNYSVLETNLGIVNGALGRRADAERHFQRAMVLEPNGGTPDFYYGRWLKQVGRPAESESRLRDAMRKAPLEFQSRHLLMQLLYEQRRWANLAALVSETQRLAPGDAPSTTFRAKAEREAARELEQAENKNRMSPSAENELELSFVHYRSGDFLGCIAAAERALALRPEYAEAYNNIGSAYAALGRWEEAIKAAEHALRIKPDFQLARNNLDWAKSQRGGHTAVPPAE